MHRKFFARGLALLFWGIAWSCSGPGISRLHSDPSTPQPLRVKAYLTLETKSGLPPFYSVIMGPYSGGADDAWKAFEMLGCQSEDQVYQVLGIDPEQDPSFLLTPKDLEDALLTDYAETPPMRRDLEQFYGLNGRLIHCTIPTQYSQTWYTDFGNDYYFPSDATSNLYYHVDQSCAALVDIYAASMSESTTPTVGKPEDLTTPVLDVACHSSRKTINPAFEGWTLGVAESENLNFYRTDKTQKESVRLLVLAYEQGGEKISINILKLNKESIPGAGVGLASVNSNLQLGRQFIKASVLAGANPGETAFALSLPYSLNNSVMLKLTENPLYEICTLGAPSDCRTKAYKIIEEKDDLDKPLYPRLFKLIPVSFKNTEKTFDGDKLWDVLSLTDPTDNKVQRIGLEACGKVQLAPLFGVSSPTAISHDTGLPELKSAAIAQYNSFKELTLTKKIICLAGTDQICRKDVRSETDLISGLKGIGCEINHRILSLNLLQDISMTQPLAVVPAVQFARIELKGQPLPDGNGMTHYPRLIKNYPAADYSAFLQFDKYPELSLKNLVIKNNQNSQGDIAIDARDTASLYLEGISIPTPELIQPFAFGLRLSKTRTVARHITIEAGQQAINATMSGITILQQPNRLSGQTGLRLIKSYLGFDSLEVTTREKAAIEIVNGTALFGQNFKAVSDVTPFSIGYWFERGKSSLALSSSELRGFYDSTYFKPDASNNQPVDSEINLTKSVCAATANDSKRICKTIQP